MGVLHTGTMGPFDYGPMARWHYGSVRLWETYVIVGPLRDYQGLRLCGNYGNMGPPLSDHLWDWDYATVGLLVNCGTVRLRECGVTVGPLLELYYGTMGPLCYYGTMGQQLWDRYGAMGLRD